MSASGHECGVDEAGRGPLAGPVCAAAVILPDRHPIAGLADSKKLSPVARERLRRVIEADAIAWSIALATVEEIDRLNILGATLLAMARAVEGLSVVPSRALVDGTHCPSVRMPVRAIVGGDATVASISAASILAKTERDRIMTLMDAQFPGYGFARHKGYPTAAHAAALAKLGPCPLHRSSFAPVRAAQTRAGSDNTDRRQA